jgi:hypothetical protein
MNSISGQDAMQRTVLNKYRTWAPSPKFPNSASARYAAAEYFPVNPKPKFKIENTDSIFTIGSCFARNVENKLLKSGFNVLTSDFSLDAEYYMGDNDGSAHRGVLNKYNPHSMATEVLRALGHLQNIPDNGFIEVSEDLWFDPQASRVKPNTLPVISMIRDNLNNVSSRIRHASVVFITLGLTETWYDSKTGLSLNQPPNPVHIRSLGDRISFKNSNCLDVVGNLEQMIGAINEANGGNTKILITVSPVPMGSTFSGVDVVIANTHSKSTLRAAASIIVDKYENVDYFPSFEIVTNSPRDLAWKEDGAHVQNEMVGFVIDTFAAAYFK